MIPMFLLSYLKINNLQFRFFYKGICGFAQQKINEISGNLIYSKQENDDIVLIVIQIKV